MKSIRTLVFVPPFIILAISVMTGYFFPQEFAKVMQNTTQWILSSFGWLFNVTSLSMVFICFFTYFSPLGRVKIGGEDAVPLLSIWRWFAILLCTTIAIGILFWGSAEPIFHFTYPPESLGIAPRSEDAARFALSSMFMHWSFTPYCIYTVPSLMSALAFYNMKQPYSLGSLLSPIFGQQIHGKSGQIVDSICLFSLMAGMAAGLGSGVLTIFGGLDTLFSVERSTFIFFLITFAIVITFCISAATGLMKGIRILSEYNLQLYLMVALFVFIFGPTLSIIKQSTGAMGEYITTFLPRSLLNVFSEEPWAQSWTIFYWANWMAWAPVTALFLGRLGYGYRVRTFILMNAVLPALFGCLWMAIFSGTALHYQMHGSQDLYTLIQNAGPEAVVYKIFSYLPLAKGMAILFVITAFMSFVTASDSNTESMSGLSTTGLSPDSPSPPSWIKFVLGGFIGVLSWFMISTSGIDGIKQMSNIGGLPALFLLILVSFSLIKVAYTPHSYIDSCTKK